MTPENVWYRATVTLTDAPRYTQIGGYVRFDEEGWVTIHPNGSMPDRYMQMYPISSIQSIARFDTPATHDELVRNNVIPWTDEKR